MFDEKQAFLIQGLLGDGAVEELAKSAMYKEITNSTVDPQEVAVALKIVPRIVLRWLEMLLAPLNPRDSRIYDLDPLCHKSIGAKLHITKHAPDVYQGEIVRDGKIIARIFNRSLPSVGLVIMTTFEMYDLDAEELKPQTIQPPPDILAEVRAIIDRRLNLQSAVESIVDHKLAEMRAVKSAILDIVTSSNNLKDNGNAEPEPKVSLDDFRSNDTVSTSKSKIKQILDKRRSPEIVIAKGETFNCPDCGTKIFAQGNFTPCICFGDDRHKKIFLAKSEHGFKVKFSKSWEPENIELILEALKAKNHPHEED